MNFDISAILLGLHLPSFSTVTHNFKHALIVQC